VSLRCRVVGALGVLAAAGAIAGAPAPANPPESPRLVLVLSIDQMRYDYLVRFRPFFEGGLKQLLDQGAVFTEARYRHASTETAPGHSVILSGRSPRYTGIVANDWYDPLRHATQNAVGDPVQETLGGAARSASPANFLGYTLGDALKRAHHDSRVVGVALKDRAAILMAGRRADAAYWYGAGDGRFVTSTYYMHETPAWLEELNARKLPDGYAGRSWTRLLPDVGLYDKTAGPDAVEGEADRKDVVFPHLLKSTPPSAIYGALPATPFADEIVLQAALAAMDAHQLGRRGATDLLAVGFSATDYVGHNYGPDSQELMDQVLRLDRVLGTLLAEVDRRLGPGRVLGVLTADHGVMPLVEVLRSRGVAAQRVDPQSFRRSVEAALVKRFPGAPPLVASYDAPDFYFDLRAIEDHHLSRSDVEEEATRALLATGVVEAVYNHRQMLESAPPGDEQFELFRNAFFEPRSPHLIVSVKPHVYVGAYPGGTGHGTVHDYDRHVPILFWGTGVRPGTSTAPCGPEDIAPTLGRLLGIDYPPEEGARVLEELLIH
jgi:predicted AlkP superfamily pyrophosphatase or phosphodiesterase